MSERTEAYKEKYIFLSHTRYCNDCKYFHEMPYGKRCQKCDNGSKFKKVDKGGYKRV